MQVKTQTAPIQLHHVHFFGQQNAEMQAWYVKTFGAKARPANPGSAFVAADLPGVALNFTPSPTPVVGTTGRALDHIGFEVKNLEAFTKKLEADGIKLDRPLSQGRGAQYRHRVHQGPLGHQHRADRRAGQDSLSCGKRREVSHDVSDAWFPRCSVAAFPGSRCWPSYQLRIRRQRSRRAHRRKERRRVRRRHLEPPGVIRTCKGPGTTAPSRHSNAPAVSEKGAPLQRRRRRDQRAIGHASRAPAPRTERRISN